MTTATLETAVGALNLCLNRLANSASGYVLESNPYTTDKDKNAIGAVAEAAGADGELARECVDLIDSLEGIPRTGLPNPLFAELNYLSYPFLLDQLLSLLEADLAALTQAKSLAAGHEGAETFIGKTIETRQAQIKKYKDIRANSYKA